MSIIGVRGHDLWCLSVSRDKSYIVRTWASGGCGRLCRLLGCDSGLLFLLFVAATEIENHFTIIAPFRRVKRLLFFSSPEGSLISQRKCHFMKLNEWLGRNLHQGETGGYSRAVDSIAFDIRTRHQLVDVTMITHQWKRKRYRVLREPFYPAVERHSQAWSGECAL
ncbi:hypothetical protein BX600DRAFT_316306 [Xylariales sp. PMI_506]|nr:hypothetical protein BX600DRAFT_316306 [Xylariales sp. PMI_506]